MRINEYFVDGMSVDGVPNRNIVQHFRYPDTGTIEEWSEVVYYYSEIDPEFMDSRVCNVRKVDEAQMHRTINDLLELGYQQFYPEVGANE